METAARFVLRHRWWVIAFWAIALVAGGFAAGSVPDRLSADISLPGQEGSQAQVELQKAYGVDALPAYVPVLTAPAGETVAEHRDDVAAVADAMRNRPGTQVFDYGSTGDPKFLTDDGRSTFVLVYAP